MNNKVYASNVLHSIWLHTISPANKYCVGLMLFNKPNTNNFNSAILYVGPICKANIRKGKLLLSNFYVAHDDVGPTLVLRCAPNAKLSANSITVGLRWPNVVMLSGETNSL